MRPDMEGCRIAMRLSKVCVIDGDELITARIEA
jgi:hypothetical protein